MGGGGEVLLLDSVCLEIHFSGVGDSRIKGNWISGRGNAGGGRVGERIVWTHQEGPGRPAAYLVVECHHDQGKDCLRLRSVNSSEINVHQSGQTCLS